MSKRSLEDQKQADAFCVLLEWSGKANAETTKTETAEAGRNLQVFQTFFPRYAEALERWREQQEDRADDFNILAIKTSKGVGSLCFCGA
jgi:hypothetical protein